MDDPLPMAMEVASTRLPGLGSWELGGGCREDLGGVGGGEEEQGCSRCMFPCMLLLKERNSKLSRAEK